MSLSNPALPHSNRASSGAKRKAPLEGEVIPPTIRVIASEREVGAPPTPRAGFRVRLSTALLASALALTLTGSCGFAAWRWHAREAALSSGPGPTAIALARLAKDMGELKAAVDATRQDDTARILKKNVEQLKGELDALRSSNTTSVAQLTAKLDRSSQVAAPGTADILARLDKLDHDPRMTDIAARLDRIEHQVAAPMPTGTIAEAPRPAPALPQSFVPQATAASGKTMASAASGKGMKSMVLDNWIVRDVYSGIALVEGRSGSIREVVPGESLPGAGEVRSIERRGRNWVVVTSRGIIDTETW